MFFCLLSEAEGSVMRMCKNVFGFLLFLAVPTAAIGDKPAKTRFPDYRPVAGWPVLPASLKFGPVSAVATDSQDRVYVLQRAQPPVLVFDQTGKFLRSWGKGLTKNPHGLRIDHANHVWITDTGRHLVMKFDTKGKLLLSLGKNNQAGDGPAHFNKPTDVAVAPSGEVFVADGYVNARVVKFSSKGKFLKEWGKKGSGKGEFDLPHAIRVDGKGRVYVGDRENNRVQVFDSNGKFIAQWHASGAPYGLYLTDNRLFVANGRAQWIMVLDLHGNPLGRWGTGAGESNAPHWVCVDRRGAVYVAYVGGRRIQKFTPR
jgi:DNA-binding beta-propeller fold protein YncE